MESRIIISCLCSVFFVQLSHCQQRFLLSQNGIGNNRLPKNLPIRQNLGGQLVNNVGAFQQSMTPLNNRLVISGTTQFNNNGLRRNQLPLNNFQVGLNGLTVRQTPINSLNRLNNLAPNPLSRLNQVGVNRAGVNNLGTNTLQLNRFRTNGLNLIQNGLRINPTGANSLQMVNLGANNIGLNRVQIENGLSLNQLGGNTLGAQIRGNSLTTQLAGNRLGTQFAGNGVTTQLVGNGLANQFAGNGVTTQIVGNGLANQFAGKGLATQFVGNRLAPQIGNGFGFNQLGLNNIDLNSPGRNQRLITKPMLHSGDILEKQLKLRKKINQAIQEAVGI